MTRLHWRKWLIAFVCLSMTLAAQTLHAQPPSRAEAIVGDEWLVADFRGLIEHLKTTVASR